MLIEDEVPGEGKHRTGCSQLRRGARWKSRTGAGDQGEEAAPDANSEASCALGGGVRGRGRGLQGPGDAGEEATPTRLLFFVSARTNKRHHHHHHAA